jgi:prepilin signal peptidase PulO-like enzyme (type II secretory pathway)
LDLSSQRASPLVVASTKLPFALSVTVAWLWGQEAAISIALATTITLVVSIDLGSWASPFHPDTLLCSALADEFIAVLLFQSEIRLAFNSHSF